jgi:hypothetical protein
MPRVREKQGDVMLDPAAPRMPYRIRWATPIAVVALALLAAPAGPQTAFLAGRLAARIRPLPGANAPASRCPDAAPLRGQWGDGEAARLLPAARRRP